MKRISAIALLILIGLTCINGQETEKKQYKTVKISIAPEIDGILNDDAWLAGEWVDDFTQNEPFNGRPASQRTEFKILYDDDNLYAAFKAYDTSPDSIVSRLSRRDNSDGDLVGIILDSFHDLRTGFLFGVSSSGVKYDQVFTNDGDNEDPSWDPNWWVKTSVNEEGWVAEMKIPLSQLRFEKNSGNVWGLEVARILYRKNETSFWQHIPKDAPGFIHQMGELVGLERIRPRKILDITPYGVGKVETFKSEPDNPFLDKGRNSKISGGIDAKIGLTNNMTMDLTINPDFGQVEADPSEVNLTAYETFFNEKRPFFIEGNNITDFNLGIGDGDVGNDNLFYSRRIGRRPQGSPELEDGTYADIPISTTILGAAKLTGKTKDGLSLGFIEAVTAVEQAEIDTEGQRSYKTVEPLTNYFIGRMQKDFNEGKTILGGIFTGTNRDLDADLLKSLHKSAYTGGIDFTQYFRSKKWMFNINSAFSSVSGSKEAIEETQKSSARYFQRPDNDYTDLDPDRTSLSGSGGRVQLMKLNGHLNLMGAVTWKTPGFETNDMGYLREADQILAVVWAGYNQWEPKWIYRRYNLNLDVYTISNFGGDRIGRGLEWNGSVTLKNYWNAWGGGNLNSNSLSTGILRGGPSMKTPGNINLFAGFSTDHRKKLELEFRFNTSRGFNNYSSNTYSGIELSFKPANYLTLSLDPGFSKSYTELQYVSQEDYNGSDRYVFASIDRKTISASFRINFNLSPDLTVQYWGQPFIASGKYHNYKYITDPKADRYSNRFKTYIADQITPDEDYFNIDENLDGINDYGFDREDFIVREFLSNLVLRWEYNPGSSVYLVWSQTRNGSERTGSMDYLNDLSDLFDRDDNTPHNIFLVKFSYRFGLN
ncbi:MAG: DUF5916 domain-containing protein [Bacteroidales bacterium]|jgi:hypothetical protein|nr:DUF5916 domain-containing protein [Bacteroidales bacterium]